MQEITALLGITTALAVGAASPGPSFIMVARTAVSSSRANGLGAALGMGIGGLLFATAALLGLNGLLLAVPSLYLLLKAVGGLYLAYLGLRIWRGAKTQNRYCLRQRVCCLSSAPYFPGVQPWYCWPGLPD